LDLGGKGDHIKVDITRKEKLEFEPIYGKVIHSYSDLEDEFNIKSYNLEEITIEKMVALMDRTIARDLYDFNYLTSDVMIELKNIYFEFERKAVNKGHNPKDFVEKVTRKESIYKKAWDESLGYQIKELPKFVDVWRNIRKQFRKIKKIKDEG
jgi:predicted nucleotidyltransferase component of viral defense system